MTFEYTVLLSFIIKIIITYLVINYLVQKVKDRNKNK